MREERHDLQLPHGIKLFYTASRNGNFVTVTLDLTKAKFRLSETDQLALAQLPNARRHRRCISSEKVVIRVLRKDLLDALEVILEILNRHINEEKVPKQSQTVELVLAPIHRHDGNFYSVRGKLNPVLRETETEYIIEVKEDDKKIVIPKANAISIPKSLYDFGDNMVFFPILHHDTGRFEFLFAHRDKVFDRGFIYVYT